MEQDRSYARTTQHSGITEIFFVRHGETTHNLAGILQGQLEAKLNELGWKQAYAVAERLAKESKISALYSSDLKRAFDTASVIAEKCNLKVIAHPAWRERHLGKLQGLKRKEAPLLEPEAFCAFVCDEGDKEIPGGGESYNQLFSRVVTALEDIAEKHRGAKVVVVTHGGTLSAIWQFVQGKRSTGKASNTSINVIHSYKDGKWVVHNWGDTSHLKDVGFTTSAIGGDRESG
eukprot:TRINITY_DN14847_c0_g1_i1.p1 TRINITY_DN14847_c0_g1~~TRINITY_DN14847_c0_g1_i1.p1  ORF type:complete len:232 (+),score=65.87 TRINITY_DN14847_c0_g1_i1:149-844(+)